MATRIDLPHGYRIDVEPGGWGVRSGEWSPVIGWYETLFEAVNAAGEHYARCCISGGEGMTLAEACETVNVCRAEFLAGIWNAPLPGGAFDN